MLLISVMPLPARAAALVSPHLCNTSAAGKIECAKAFCRDEAQALSHTRLMLPQEMTRRMGATDTAAIVCHCVPTPPTEPQKFQILMHGKVAGAPRREWN